MTCNQRRATAWSALAAGALAVAQPACTAAQDPLESPAPNQEQLPPVGYGTLGQDDIGISLRTESFSVGVIPLYEGIIRLLAPDTYASMHRLMESRGAEIDSAASRNGVRDPAVFLVSFYGREPRVRFDPEALTITGQNRLFRPIGILPVSPAFGDRQLNQRETATAIYLYEGGIRLADPFTLSYDGISSDQWERILRILERERAAVETRAAAGRKPGTS